MTDSGVLGLTRLTGRFAGRPQQSRKNLQQPDTGNSTASNNTVVPSAVIALPLATLKGYAGIRFGAEPPKSFSAALRSKQLTGANSSKSVKVPLVMTFWNFLDEVERNPSMYLRSASQYTVDAMEYYGTKKDKVLGEDITRFDFVNKPWLSPMFRDKTALEGQELVLDRIHKVLKQFAVQKNPTRMIVLHGPNGSGKNETMATLFQVLENYSTQDAGARYTFSWVFKNTDELRDIVLPGSIGKKALSGSKNKGPIPVKKIGLKIPANLNSNPLFLLSKDTREALLKNLQNEKKIDDNFNVDYVLEGGRLDSNSLAIYNALLEHYDGDLEKVLNHVQVERWEMSKQQGRGLSMIQSGTVYEADLQPVTPNINWDLLPATLRAAGIHTVKGAIPGANGGHIQLTDMLKKHPDELKFLLETPLSGIVKIRQGGHPAYSVEEQLDAIFWGDVNDKDIIMNMRNNASWESLQHRLLYVQVPYLRQYKSEAGIYQHKLKQIIQNGRHISPHALEAFALWATMTRLFKPNALWQEYKNIPFLTLAVNDMNLLEKALLYQGEDPNSFELDPDKQKYKADKIAVITKNLDKVVKEYNYGLGKTKFYFYEGGTGVSPREAEEMLGRTTNVNADQCYSVVEVFKSLEEQVKDGVTYEKELLAYLKEAQDANVPGVPKGTHPGASDLLKLAKGHSQRQIQSEIKSALGIYQNQDDHIHKLHRYMEHVRAMITDTPVADAFQSPMDEKPDLNFIKEMEKTIIPKAMDVDKFRREKILSKTALWKNDIPEQSNIKALYPDELKLMYSADEKNNLQYLNEFKEDIQRFWGHQEEFDVTRLQGTPKKRAERLHRALGVLAPKNPACEDKGYCIKCLPKIIDWAFEGQLTGSK